MIRVNLAKGKKSGTGQGGGFDLSGLLGRFKGVGGGGGGSDFDFRKSQLIRAIALAVLCYLGMGIVEDKKKEEIAHVRVEADRIVKENQTILSRLAETKGYEATKKALEADEESIRVKLEIIAKLMDNRDAPSRLMLQIAQSIPEEVWLSDMSVRDELVKFKGNTLGLPQVSELISKLGETSMLSDVFLSNTQETAFNEGGTSSKNDKRVQAFEISAKRRRL